MPYTQFLSGNVSQLAGLLKNASNGKNIYLFKDNSGNLVAYESENAQSANNVGYGYQFLNGEVSYTTFPVTSILNIPYDYNYTTLGNLNLSNNYISVWIDGKEQKNISVSSQKVMSKGYSTNEQVTETTSSQSFTYSNNTIDLSSSANLESQNLITFKQFFKFIMTFKIPNFINNGVIFKHNRLILKMSSQTAPQGGTTNQLCIFDNTTFIKGTTIVPSATTIYSVYYDGTLLRINNETCVMVQQSTPAFYGSGDYKMYIGMDSSQLNPSNIKFHELLYFTSASDSISFNSTDAMNFAKTKWGWSDYVSGDYIPIPPDPWSVGSNVSFFMDYADFATNPTSISHTGIGQFTHFTGTYTYKTNEADSLGRVAKKVLSLGGSDTRIYFDYRGPANNLFVSQGSNFYTFIACLKVSGPNVSNTFNLLRNQSSSGLSELFGMNPSSSFQYLYVGQGGNIQFNKNGGGLLTSQQYFIVSFTRTADLFGPWLSTASVKARINGLPANIASVTNGTSAGTVQIDFYSLHENNTITTEIVSYFVYYGDTMSDSHVEKVEAYIAHNSFTQPPSVTGLLPPSHPFYSAPPSSF